MLDKSDSLRVFNTTQTKVSQTLYHDTLFMCMWMCPSLDMCVYTHACAHARALTHNAGMTEHVQVYVDGRLDRA